MRPIDADTLKEDLWLAYETECENIPFMDNDGRMSLDAVEEVINNSQTLRDWVPVREAMPPEISDEFGEHGSDLCLTQSLDEDAHPYFTLNFTTDGKWMLDRHVVAWMPLPEPYEGG